MTLSLAERTHVYAEARLQRELTPGERHIDLVAADVALETAKARLHAAIVKEQARYARGIVSDGRGRMEVTGGMAIALSDCWKAGRDAAKAELVSMGINPDPPREFIDEDGRITILDQLRAGLGETLLLNLRILLGRVDAAGVEATLSGFAFGAVAKEMQKVPGALDIASRMISGAYSGGLAFTYEQHTDLFDAWQYTGIQDGAQCDRCRAHDGEVYATLDEAYQVLPGFGPNPACFGSGRCRCRLMPAPPDEIPADRAIPPSR